MPSLLRAKALSSTTLISYPTFDVARDVFLYFLALSRVIFIPVYCYYQGANLLHANTLTFAPPLREIPLP